MQRPGSLDNICGERNGVVASRQVLQTYALTRSTYAHVACHRGPHLLAQKAWTLFEQRLLECRVEIQYSGHSPFDNLSSGNMLASHFRRRLLSSFACISFVHSLKKFCQCSTTLSSSQCDEVLPDGPDGDRFQHTSSADIGCWCSLMM